MAAALVEGFIALLLVFPPRIAPLQSLARYYYAGLDRDIIQFNRAAARWDAELFYTLRPGRFTFVQREFRHEFRVNSRGLRDDEEALRAPEIIAVGDSFTMGWGVAQHETYPKVLEGATGKRTLNAGISSYGTVREMRMLDRLDRSALRYVIVQYDADDAPENEAFLGRGNRHVSRPEAAWVRAAASVEARRHYYPGLYVWTAAYRGYHALVDRRPARPAPARDEVDLFLNALAHGPRSAPSGVTFLVWCIPGSDIARDLEARLRAGARPAPDSRVVVVDVAPALDPARHYWVLDDHLNAAGHRVVAERLAEAIHRLERPGRL